MHPTACSIFFFHILWKVHMQKLMAASLFPPFTNQLTTHYNSDHFCLMYLNKSLTTMIGKHHYRHFKDSYPFLAKKMYD